MHILIVGGAAISYTDVRCSSEETTEKLRPEGAWLREESAVVLQLVEVGREVSWSLGKEEVSNQSKGKVMVGR